LTFTKIRAMLGESKQQRAKLNYDGRKIEMWVLRQGPGEEQQPREKRYRDPVPKM